MTKSLRTRFAPSPTGYLHVGGARTAIYSWLFAKRMGGTFILRIEDTDLERSTEQSIQAIFEGMQWLGLDYDEGPFYQTKRFDRYREVVEQLLKTGHAYCCYCSKERLEKLREEQKQKNQKPRYDRHCRHETKKLDAPFVVRFATPETGEVSFVDQIRGKISINNAELDDLIIARSDGVPTYNLTVVVDDWDMKISHVIRGDDHINNTPRQIHILSALGAEVPLYAHVPMILGSDGKRLSKRHGAVSVMQYREEGILPEALLNYLVRLGWSHGDQEIFSCEELIQYFDLEHVNCSPAAFDPEKLAWLNQHYLKQSNPNTLVPLLQEQLAHENIPNDSAVDLEKLISIQVERNKNLRDMAKSSRYFFLDVEYDEKATAKHLRAEINEPLTAVREQLAILSNWQADKIHQVIIDVAEKYALKLGKLAQPIRVAVTGNTVSPSIDVTLELIGQQRVLQRLDYALRLSE